MTDPTDPTDPTLPLPTTPEGVPPAGAAAGPDVVGGTPEAPVAAPVAPAPAATVPAAGFLRRHAVGVALVAGALAVVVLAGGTAWGVSAAVAAGQAGAAMTTAAQNQAAGSKASTRTHAKTSGANAKHAHGLRGTLTAISGDTWTLQTAAGASVTVALTSSTAFGTAAAPAERSTFVVGDRVGVLGARSGSTVTATRVLMVPASGRTTASPTPGPTT